MTEPTARSDADIVRDANELARQFYMMMGYLQKEGYRFDKATHPHERMCWQMSCMAFDILTATDPDEAVANTEDE